MARAEAGTLRRMAWTLGALAWLLPAALDADAFFSAQTPTAQLGRPGQKALLSWDGGTETLILSSSVQVPSLQDLAWVLALPSLSPPVVVPTAFHAFNAMTWLFISPQQELAAEKDPWTMSFRASGISQLTQVPDEWIAADDLTVLRPRGPGAVAQWLRSRGYQVDAEAARRLPVSADGVPVYYVIQRLDLWKRQRPIVAKAQLAWRALWASYVAQCQWIDAQAQSMHRPERLLPRALKGLDWDPLGGLQDRLNSPANPADLPVLRGWHLSGGFEVVERYAAPKEDELPLVDPTRRVWILLKNGVPRQVLNRIDGRYEQTRPGLAAALGGTDGVLRGYPTACVREIQDLVQRHFADGQGGSQADVVATRARIEAYGETIPGWGQMSTLKGMAQRLFSIPGLDPATGEGPWESQVAMLPLLHSDGPYADPAGDLNDLLRKLRSGVVMPVQIVFHPPAPTLPLRLSDLGSGQTTVELYTLGTGPPAAPAALVHDADRPLDARTRVHLDCQPPVPEGATGGPYNFHGDAAGPRDYMVFGSAKNLGTRRSDL